MWRSSSNDSITGRSHHSWVRWPNTTPMRRDMGDALLVRHEPVHHDLPAAGHQHAGQHLDRGRLARAVRPDVADHLAGLDPNETPSTALSMADTRAPAASSSRRSGPPRRTATLKVFRRSSTSISDIAIPFL